MRPDILIIDEVPAVGDEAFQRKCLDRMGAFHEAGVTILFVSYDAALVRRMCHRAVWLEHGRVRATGPAAQVVAQSQSAGHG
ncbi:MAG: hypothetical protein HYY33_03665 [Chloroflexi bacterium]|nr:hypothetical protein [Chloroflexota bacterium]